MEDDDIVSDTPSGHNVPWSWVAMCAVSLVVLLIGNSWNKAQNEAAEQAKEHAEDHIKMRLQDFTIQGLDSKMDNLQNTVENNSKKNDARWGALLDALPEVNKKLKTRTPIFESEWHSDTRQ